MEPWTRLLDTYLWCQYLVDIEIGLVLGALEQSPFAQDTIVIFTSDHGDYTGAHGLRCKQYGPRTCVQCASRRSGTGSRYTRRPGLRIQRGVEPAA